MSIEIAKEKRKDAILSLQQYFERNLPEPVGDLAAGLLLDFFLQEIGPLIYNKAISDAQARLTQRLTELDAELYEEPFTHWAKTGARRGR